MKPLQILSSLLLSVGLVACSPIALEEEPPVAGDGTAHLYVNVNAFDFLPFESRAVMTLRDVSSRLSYALFYMNGEKVMATKSQVSTDAGFGAMDMRLSPGQYVLVTVAHNGTANCTISSPTEVKFANNYVTDTFTSCDTIRVLEGEQHLNICLSRRVAMLRLLLDEVLPREVTQIKFYYTGGSSTLDASLGYGSVNSRQTVLLPVPMTAYTVSGSTYEAYTFPHNETGTLKLTITAQTATGEQVAERILTEVPVRRGEITQFRGTLTGQDASGLQMELTIDDAEWTQTNYTF